MKWENFLVLTSCPQYLTKTRQCVCVCVCVCVSNVLRDNEKDKTTTKTQIDDRNVHCYLQVLNLYLNPALKKRQQICFLSLLLLLSSLSSSSSSPLCRVFILIFLRQTMSLGIQWCGYSVVTIHGAYIVSFSVESIVLLH